MKKNQVFSAVLACATASPIYTALVGAKPYINSGLASGPVHPVVAGDLVATKRGLRPLSLEGFSEDDDQNGQVDPIAPAVAAIPAVAPAVAYSAPLALPSVLPSVLPAATVIKAAEPVVEVKEVEPKAAILPAAIPALSPIAPAISYTTSAVLPASPLTYAAAPLASPAVVPVAAAPRFAQQALLAPGVIASNPLLGLPAGIPLAAVAAEEAPVEAVEAVVEA